MSHNAEAPRTRGTRPQHVVDLIEFDHCGDTRMAGKITENKPSMICSRDCCWNLGGRTSSLGSSLSGHWEHAVHAAQAIVRKKRELEQELWGGNQQNEGRRGVG